MPSRRSQAFLRKDGKIRSGGTKQSRVELFAFLVIHPSLFSQRLVILLQFSRVFVLSSSHVELARVHVLGYVPALRGRPQGLVASGTDLITLTPQLGASPNPNARAAQGAMEPAPRRCLCLTGSGPHRLLDSRCPGHSE